LVLKPSDFGANHHILFLAGNFLVKEQPIY